MNHSILVLLISMFAGFLFISCAEKQSEIMSPNATTITWKILDKEQGADAIVEDSATDFFDEVREFDMQIQMKKEHIDVDTKEKMLDTYKAYLADDILGFTQSEKSALKLLLEEISKECQFVNDLLPAEISIAKIQGNIYGEGLVFTRQNTIFIPYTYLHKDKKSDLKSEIIHDIFHIITRNNNKLIDPLYEIIGFEPLSKPISFPREIMEPWILLNPDAQSFTHAVPVDVDGEIVLIIPIIKAKNNTFSIHKPNYNEYKKLGYYILDEQEHSFTVLCNDIGRPTISVVKLQDFYFKVGSNTGFLSHPQEIMAFNFEFAVQFVNEQAMLKNLKNEGRDKIHKMIEVFNSTI